MIKEVIIIIILQEIITIIFQITIFYEIKIIMTTIIFYNIEITTIETIIIIFYNKGKK